MPAWRLLAIYASVGTAVPSKRHSCIAPLQLCPHHVAIVGLRLSTTLCSKEFDLVLVWALRSNEWFHHDQSQGASAVQKLRVPVGRTGGSRLTNRCSEPGPIKC